MYAKLTFPEGTKNTDVCRDIVRTIVNSTGAGGSTVGALEFVDAGNSVIEDTEAANWTLAAGQSIATGAAVEQDKEFFLQQAHANTAIKTVAIRMHNLDNSGFTKAENGTGYNTVVLTPVLDYGESYESTPFRPSNTASASTTTSCSHGVSAKKGKCVVHIIARNKVIAILGDQRSYLGGRSYMAILEAPTQYEMTIGRNKPSQTFFWGSERFESTFGASSLASKGNAVDYTSTNMMGTSYGQPLAYAMMDTFHDYDLDAEVRLAIVTKASWTTTITNPSNCDPSSQMTLALVLRDINQADGYSTSWNEGTSGDPKPESFIFPPSSSSWGYTPHAYTFDPVQPHLSLIRKNKEPRDANGTPSVQMFPVAFTAGNQGSWFDFSTECGLYVATNNVPRGISIINDGTDDYVAFRLFDTSNRDGVITLRK